MGTYCIVKATGCHPCGNANDNRKNELQQSGDSHSHDNMRILLLTDNHTPTGGAENYFFDLKNRLKKTPGIEVFSIGFGPIEMHGDDYYVIKGLRSKFFKLIWQILFNPVIYLRLRSQIRKFQPDVIHLHNIKQYTASVMRAVKPYQVIQTVHDYSIICPSAQNIHKDNQPCPTGMRKRCFWQHQVKYNPVIYLALVCSFYQMRRHLRKTVKMFIAPSPLLVEYLKKNSFNNTVFIPPFKKEQSSYSFDNMQPGHFLFAGSLGQHKGVHILIEEFALACKRNNHLYLTIAGTGPEELHMRQRIQTFGIEKHVRFTGWHHHLDKLYDENMAVIFPSTGFETFGLVITEAMGRARPVIGVNRGTSDWIIDDQRTGLLFDPLKKGDLAEKMLTLARNPELAKQLGTNGYEKLKNFIDNDMALEQIISLYRKCSGISSSVTPPPLKPSRKLEKLEKEHCD